MRPDTNRVLLFQPCSTQLAVSMDLGNPITLRALWFLFGFFPLRRGLWGCGGRGESCQERSKTFPATKCIFQEGQGIQPLFLAIGIKKKKLKMETQLTVADYANKAVPSATRSKDHIYRPCISSSR